MIEHDEAVIENPPVEEDPVPELPALARQNSPIPTVRRAGRSLPPSSGIAPGAVAIVSPRSFTYQTDLLWAAIRITQQEWSWPVMDPSTWLDTFLFLAMRDYGFIIAGYTRRGDDLELIPGEQPVDPPPEPPSLSDVPFGEVPRYDDDFEEPALKEEELVHANP